MSGHDNEANIPPIAIPSVVTLPAPGDEIMGEPIDVEQEEGRFDVTAAQEETRAHIALYFTKIFLLLVTLSLLIPFFFHALFPQTLPQPIESAKELVTILASILAGPFGFIVGFYFKQGRE